MNPDGITAEVKKVGNAETLVISLPISKQRSASGKTIVVATTRGNHEYGATFEGKPILIGVNAYIK